MHCDLIPKEASETLGEVADGISLASKKMKASTRSLPEFKEIGSRILQGWDEGLRELSGE